MVLEFCQTFFVFLVPMGPFNLQCIVKDFLPWFGVLDRVLFSDGVEGENAFNIRTCGSI